ncbi:MAG: hypothetical protein GQ540_00670 [Lutibacter sp.]|uniref:hypothetical protein n=1 Tax=Lutibacter sp. TaxID=1925666 RepID=UPI0019F591BE|nr:hypothetical protein [Lutibacter sp.]NOR27022.1 hypothetical protein [Lutibacter sp.]
MKTIKRTLLVLVAVISISTMNAQEEPKASFDIGVDFASRYVWRGLEFSDSPAVQPYAEYSSGNFTLGAWASYETGGQVVGQEFDFYAGYSFGAVSLGFTDYAFPVDGLSDGYFQIKNHVGEATISFDGVEKFPLSLMLGVNVYNDDANSVYTEIGYPFTIGETELSAFVGAGNEIYSVDGEFTVTNFGISAGKDIKMTDSFSLGVSASAIFNPDTEDAYLVFLISL